MTEDQYRLGPRLLALAALWSLLSGLLLALSLVAVALVAFGLLLGVLLVIGGRELLARVDAGARLWAALAAAGHAIGGAMRRIRPPSVRPRIRRVRVTTRRAAAAAPGSAVSILGRAVSSYAIAPYRVRLWAWQHVTVDGASPATRALELNELGAQLRRRGEHEEAAEQHRAALEMVRRVGDEQAEALTLNNLALALAQGGADVEAIQHLEQAATVLRKLGDEEHEGQVIANLGIVYQRQGDSEQAVQFLHQALDKLPPESSAYRKVEEELRRAS